MTKVIFSIFLSMLLLSACKAENRVQPPTISQPRQDPPAILQSVTSTPDQASHFSIATQISTPVVAQEANNNPADLCGNPYYPIVNGATWVYDMGGPGQMTYSMNASNGGDFTIVILGGESRFLIEGQCAEDGIILVNRGQDVQYQGEEGSSVVSSDTNEGITLPNDIQLGDDWSQSTTLSVKSDDLNMDSTINAIYKAVSYESVAVPAGTFLALKIEQTGTMTLNGQEIQTNGTTWYVEGIGPVKSENGVGGNIDAVAQLASYNIP